MTHRKEVLQQALFLPPEDRAFVGVALEESLATEPGQGASSEELLTELQRCSAAYRAGRASARPAKDVIVEQRRRQAGEAKA